MMNILKERWVVINGSVYTERAFEKRSEITGKKFREPQREAIAFNVGDRVAQHIVNMHNFHFAQEQPGV